MKDISLKNLTPIILDEEQKENLNYKNYETMLNSIMNDNELCNIAITGAYGAGKSTIINTYENEHRENGWMHISLAKLNNDNTENVQAKLINQIIHQINPKLIPYTRFKVKRVFGVMHMIGIALLIFLFIISAVYLITVPSAQIIEGAEISLYESFWLFKANIIMLLIGGVSLLILLMLLVNAQYKHPLIKSVQVDKSQIELVEHEKGESDDKEKFDKYLSEIIYLFEAGKIKTLIIEDLDRFDDVGIFYELRQINYLLNKKISNKKDSRLKKNKKKNSDEEKNADSIIRFFYLVKDEVFEESEERTKFFDVIVPIVPVMDNSNSYELLKKMMGDEWFNVLDKSYLRTVCMYIRDLRILKNIINEFQVYYKQLRIEERNYEAMKLFAMITYKNIWSSDFAELQRGSGIVFDTLGKIDELRKRRGEELEREICAKKEEIELIESELANDIDELDALYFETKLYTADTSPGYYLVNGQEEYAFKTRREFIHELKNSENVSWVRYRFSNPIELSKETIESGFEALNSNSEYANRKNRIFKRSENHIKKIEEEIANLRREKERVNNSSFSEIAAVGIPENIEELFNGDRKVVLVFIQDELISLDYASYMTYFYPYSISDKEIRYLNKVYMRTNDLEQEDIEVTHPELVIEYLGSKHWESVALPNKRLFKYFVNYNGSYLRKAISNLKMHKNTQFAVEMLEAIPDDDSKELYVNALLEEWKEFVQDLLGDSNLNNRLILQVILKILKLIRLDYIPKETITEFFDLVEPELIELCDVDTLNIIQRTDFKFKEAWRFEGEELEVIYANNMYHITKENIENILSNFYQLDEGADAEVNNYASIMSDKESSLAKYILENLEDYVKYVYARHYAANSQEYDVLIQFLNSEELSLDTKIALVAEMGISVQNIDEIVDVSVREQIVKYKKMDFTNANVISIWSESESITEGLKSYLKEKYSQGKCALSFEYARKYFEETSEDSTKTKKIIIQMLKLQNMGNAYKNIIHDVKVTYHSLQEIFWTDEQLKEIVSTDIIGMTESNLKLMRQHDNKHLFYKWLCNHVKSYIRLMKNEELREDRELKKLIESDIVPDDDKVSCISICKEKVSVLEKYNSAVVEAIFKHQLFDGDFTMIIHRYESNRYSKEFKEHLVQYMAIYIEDVISRQYHWPYEILLKIMKADDVSYENKIRYLAKQVEYQNIMAVSECMKYSGAKEFLKAFEGKMPKVEVNESNLALIEALKNKNWVSSYKNVNGVYMVYPKKIKK